MTNDTRSSGPVDVLAVIDRSIESARTRAESISGSAWISQKHCDDLAAARTAVAELIEAVREYRIELRKPIGCGTYDRVVARVDAALANIGGAK